MMRRETLRVGKIRNPSVAEGHSNFRFSSLSVLSVGARVVPNRAMFVVCVRATKSERLKRTVTCSFERTVSLVSLFLRERFDLVRDLFSSEKKSKGLRKIVKNLRSFLGPIF